MVNTFHIINFKTQMRNFLSQLPELWNIYRNFQNNLELV